MKFRKVLRFSSTVLASSLALLTLSTTINAIPERDLHSKYQVIIAQATALMSGSFVAAEAPTTGMAQIVEENGHKYLQINSAFTTNDQAPDLQVVLDTVEQAPPKYEGVEKNRYVNLGGLQSVTGKQRYPIPDSIDVSQFKSVAIWCRMANATMGYTPLSSNSSASTN
jgi:hypothetical protein